MSLSFWRSLSCSQPSCTRSWTNSKNLCPLIQRCASCLDNNEAGPDKSIEKSRIDLESFNSVFERFLADKKNGNIL